MYFKMYFMHFRVYFVAYSVYSPPTYGLLQQRQKILRAVDAAGR